MSSPAELGRKVRQLDNDVQSIYEMLASIQATQARQGNRLDEVSAKLDDLDVKVDQRMDEVGGKLDAIIAALADVKRPESG